MIKVIASDMDGTLLGDNHKVAPETVEAIREAQNPLYDSNRKKL